MPTFAQITVDGTEPYIVGNQPYFGTYNFGFSGRNLSPANTTFIKVTGDINYRGDLTPEPLSQADALPSSLFSLSTNPNVTDRLVYDTTSRSLDFVGVMSQSDLNFLLNPTVYVVDQNGNPVLNANGNPETTSVVLTPAQKATINQLYTDSQTANISNESLALAGPGVFKINANNINLGNSGGITVNPLDSALANISLQSAELDIHTSGDLQMTASKIANEGLLGDINLMVDGTLNVGGQFTAFDDPSAAKGIYTTSGGNVSVTADGDVNVNSSRIAAYNGGNLTVESRNGDVNAGVGGAGYVSVNSQELDSNGELDFITQSIPGSGILATTLPGSLATSLGNISVNAPNGSINASYGGILQIAFNGADTQNSLIDLNAGLDIIATGSGVIGANVTLNAGRTFTGLVVAQHHLIAVAQNFGPGLLFGPSVSVNQTGDNGGGIPIQIVSDNPVTENGIQVPETAPDVASAPREVAQTAADSTTVASNADDQNAAPDDEQKKKKGITLAQKVGRVTVLLPTKTN
jgi:hypothetical protein